MAIKNKTKSLAIAINKLVKIESVRILKTLIWAPEIDKKIKLCDFFKDYIF